MFNFHSQITNDSLQTLPEGGRATGRSGRASLARLTTKTKIAGWLCWLGLLSAFASESIQGATVQFVHQFAPLTHASNTPGSLLLATDGNFYGVSSAGGANGEGTVFVVSPAGVLTTLHDFGAINNLGDNSDGTGASARLVQGTDGSFYGVALQGGVNNTGTIFKITPAGAFTTVLSFGALPPNGNNPGGAYPRAGLLLGSDGNFYGTASAGGANGRGVIYKVTPDGTTTTLYAFSAVTNSKNTDGAAPYGSLVQGSDGNFYGTTQSGGANSNGTIFQLTAAGTFTALHSFSATNGSAVNSEGARPTAGMIQGTDGNFYGTTASGGAAGKGTFFQLTVAGTVTALHSFTTAEGVTPSTVLQGSDGNFYGTAKSGGASGLGTVYRITPGGVLTLLHTFGGYDGQGPSNGLVQDTAGNLYGVTGAGGVYNGGAFYRLASNGTFAKLSNFGLNSNGDGASIDAPLVLGADGNYYGTANSGGANGNGTVFKMTPAGAVTVLHTFSAEDDSFANADGAFPNAGLLLGSDGNFYGTASGGGTGATGTVFQVTPAGVFTTLSSFDPFTGSTSDNGNTNGLGAYPYAALCQGRDGNFYGTASQGGAYGSGTVFVVTPDGSLTLLYTFSAPNASGFNGDGLEPFAGLVQGTDGNFYGMARYGGANDTGTVFQVTPAGGFMTLASLAALSDGNYNATGAYPTKALIQATDGNFYGTAGYGGTQGGGTAFQVTLAGAITTLHTFATLDANHNTSDGVDPEASLVQGRNGSFYGTARRGSTNEDGVVFQLTSSGVFTTLYTFGSVSSGGGANSYASLVPGRTGTVLFGTTLAGGNGAGTVFKVNLLSSALAAATAVASP